MIGKETILWRILDDTVAFNFRTVGNEYIVQQYAFVQGNTAEVMERP